MKKQAEHPSGLTITFSEDDHSYIDDTGKQYTSATTFIGQFFPKFDVDKMSRKCAGAGKYEGMTAEEIRAAWKTEAERGQREGTNLHLYCERLISGNGPLPEPQSEREDKLFDQGARAVLALLERFEFVEAEKIVFSPKMGIAGTIDLLMLDRKRNDLLILDYKQNKKISQENLWENCQFPIQNLEATDFNKYQLQLTLYQHILTQELYYPEVMDCRRAIIHITPDGAQSHKTDFMGVEIVGMLVAANGEGEPE